MTVAPSRPSSSPMIAKMKSVVAFGTHPHFILPAPSPTPNSPPEPTAYLPWFVCQQLVVGCAWQLKNPVIRLSR